MNRTLTSVATAGLVVVASGGLLVGLAGSAAAATSPPWEPDGSSVGSLSFYDSAGNPVTSGSINSPVSAFVEGSVSPRAGDTVATLFAYTPVLGQAPGAWSGEALSGSTNYPNASAPGALKTATLPVVTGDPGDETIATYVGDFPNNDTSTTDGYSGIYQLRLKTSASGKGATSTYDSVDIQVTGTQWSVVYPVPVATATSTTLTTAPTSPQVQGTSVTLTATETPAAAGTVQFVDGTTNIGTPVTVAAGVATISTSTLAVGSHALHAVFTPTSSAFAGSTGDATFAVTAAPAPATNTSLSVNPTTAPAFTSVALTSNVTLASNSTALASGTGTVQFFDNGTTSLGSASVGTGGVATLNYGSFTVGTHHITAQFQPANPSTFASSTSAEVDFTATTPTIAPDAQTVDVTIPAGGLVISSPYTPSNPFHLGTAVLDANDSKFTASNTFGSASAPAAGVSITDTRAGELPWTASATVTDFTDGATPTPDVINGSNLAFTGITPVQVPGNGLLASSVGTSDVSTAATAGTPYSPTSTTPDGLKGGPHAFAHANQGFGQVYVDGLLTLSAPTSTPAGTYTATLTFTIA